MANKNAAAGKSLVKNERPSKEADSKKQAVEKTTLLRIASDPIRLKDKIGFYACSELGLVLYIPKKGQLTFSGDLVEVVLPKKELRKDFKSGALIVE